MTKEEIDIRVRVADDSNCLKVEPARLLPGVLGTLLGIDPCCTEAKQPCRAVPQLGQVGIVQPFA